MSDTPAPVATGSPPVAGNPKVTITKAGAIARLSLDSAITALAALIALHGAGVKIGPWEVAGVALLTLKSLKSYVSQTWANAFGQTPDTSDGDTTNEHPSRP